MTVAWFVLLAAMLTAYAVLDGFDLGVGAMHLLAARSDEERRASLGSIGPIWNANEVWLIAAGGMLVASFPRVYATGFSGFYLALMLVLWLLILRGVAIEARSQLASPLWRSFWDAGFCVGSALLALLLGVALGNMVRGLPVRADGTFRGSFALLLNPYSLLVGLLSLIALSWHGMNYLRTKCDGELQARATRYASRLSLAVAALTIAVTIATLALRHGVLANFGRAPYLAVLPISIVISLVLSLRSRHAGHEARAFRASVLYIVATLGSAAATVFPALLPSTIDARYSLTIDNSASSPHALATAFWANVVGMAAVVAYSIAIQRVFRGKTRVGDHGS